MRGIITRKGLQEHGDSRSMAVLPCSGEWSLTITPNSKLSDHNMTTMVIGQKHGVMDGPKADSVYMQALISVYRF